jgi:hypothetical protein
MRQGLAAFVFFLTLAATFGTAILGRLRARRAEGEEDLAGEA